MPSLKTGVIDMMAPGSPASGRFAPFPLCRWGVFWGTVVTLLYVGESVSWLLSPVLYCPHSDLCDLALLKPLWQLFTYMEYSRLEDVTQPGILLPLHRALTELFFVTENRAQVRSCWCFLCCPKAGVWPEVQVLASVPSPGET